MDLKDLGTSAILQHKDTKYNATIMEIYKDKTGVCHCKLTFKENNKECVNTLTNVNKQ